MYMLHYSLTSHSVLHDKVQLPEEDKDPLRFNEGLIVGRFILILSEEALFADGSLTHQGYYMKANNYM